MLTIEGGDSYEHDYGKRWHDNLLQGWGEGPVVTFSHGWPLNSDAWDGQMLFLAQNGFRVVAHDRVAMAAQAKLRPERHERICRGSVCCH